MKSLCLFAVVVVCACLITACKKKRTNQDLYEESTASGLSFYKNKDTIYSPKGGSPHGDFKLKLNGAAKEQVDASGVLPAGASFSDGTLIVKEVYKNGVLDLYAVMKKDGSSKYAAGGWVWAEYGPEGKTIYNASRKGEGCLGCHSAGDARDHVRSFTLH